MLICFDWVFPGVWNYLARLGAQIICHPANLVLEGKCEKGTIVRAMENRVFIISADRVGEERGLRFVGGSQIVDPEGNVISKAPAEGEYLDMVKIDPEMALDKYITPRNHVIDDAQWALYPPPGEQKEQ
jgi:predicted amidohydrolase